MGHQSRIKRQRKQATAQAKAGLRRLSDEALVQLGVALAAHWGDANYEDKLVVGEMVRRGLMAPVEAGQ